MIFKGLKDRFTRAVQLSKTARDTGKIGVTPDFEIAEGSDDFRINTESDNQLEFAIKMLNG